MEDVVRIKAVVGTGFSGCKHEDISEVDRSWWESLTPIQREQVIEDYAIELRNNVIEVSAWVMEEGEDD